jgi:hypothetical protein
MHWIDTAHLKQYTPSGKPVAKVIRVRLLICRTLVDLVF